MRTLVQELPRFLAGLTILVAPLVLLVVGILLVAAPGRTMLAVVLLAGGLYFHVVTLPSGLSHRVAIEDGAATSDAVACRLGAIGQPVSQCPSVQLPDPLDAGKVKRPQDD